MTRLTRSIALFSICTSTLLAAAPAALAAPAWTLNSLANTTVAPGGTLEYLMEAYNGGDAATSGEFSVVADLPAGLTGVSAKLRDGATGAIHPCFDAADGSSPVADASSVVCRSSTEVPARNTDHSLEKLVLTVKADPSANGVLTTNFAIAGGGAADASTVDPTLVSTSAPEFGIDAFDGNFGDAVGNPMTQAAAHPAASSTSIDFNTATSSLPLYGSAWPVEPVKDVLIDLPPGFVGNPAAADRCTVPELANTNGGSFDPRPLCPPGSQVGTTVIRIKGTHQGLSGPNSIGPLPVFNLIPPLGAPAALGFNVFGSIVVLDGAVRAGGDYGISVNAENVPEGLALDGTKVDLWGVPGDTSHDAERACSGEAAPALGGPTCKSDAPVRAFLRLPTSCTDPGVGLPTTAHVDSWAHPGVFKTRTWFSHEPPGYPYAPEDWGPRVGIEGCEAVPFSPSFSATTTTKQADNPTGLDVAISMPQQGLREPEAISESDLKTARVLLPEGISVNPAAASGQGACSAEQIGYKAGTSAPIEFSAAPSQCPDSAKIGTVELESPLLTEPEEPETDRVLNGAVYLAKQTDNPFGSLLAMYLVVEDEQSGVTLKLPGEISADPGSGRLETVFDENPQLPFEHLRLHLFGGSRAALKTPAACGEYSSAASLTGWSGKTVQASSSFTINEGCGGGFAPKLEAGTQNPLAGQSSPFSLRITREDGEAQLGGLTATLAPGLTGYLKGIPYCPDSVLAGISGDLGTGAAQEGSPSCPAASRVGTVTVGAGAGPTPFFTQSGRAYLAGPYRGAPLSLAVVAPAVAGPFDLGSVVVRNALRIDPATAQITAVSDPLPSILHGIPLDLRDVRVDLDRDHFALNPTNCEPMQIGSNISAITGATASPSVHFQASGCDRLGFKPRLALKLKGGTKRSKNPAVTAVMRPREGNANAKTISVALPHSEFLAQSHIRTICTRVQFAANACPAGSVYGRVTAKTPILDQPLTGNVYLRSSDHPLPDMVLKLQGPPSQPIEIDAVGRIDTDKAGGIRTTFEGLPDAPLTEVVLRLPGGRKSLIENSTDICRSKKRATVKMGAQNNMLREFRPALQVKGCKKAGRHGKGLRHRHSKGNPR